MGNLVNKSDKFLSWGRVHRYTHNIIEPKGPQENFFSDIDCQWVLPYGMGRSYGDLCLNENNTLLWTRNLSHFIAFDIETSILEVEAGVCFSDIIKFFLPRGYFLPVTPGTQFVTVGGAIASDVHGKNHHVDGTFGSHVLEIKLLRSDGKIYECTAVKNSDLYRATIGGMGLTGLILSAKFKLKKNVGPFIYQETIPFQNLEEFLLMSREYSHKTYSVGWFDSLSSGQQLGRGLLMLGEHTSPVDNENEFINSSKTNNILEVISESPNLLNKYTVKAFNSVYYRKTFLKKKNEIVSYRSFFYPLDAFSAWNKLYGKKGFYQYQCTLPLDITSTKHTSVHDLLRTIQKSQIGSFLAVIKSFGEVSSPGLMSYPSMGVTVALDFPNLGIPVNKLFKELNKIVSSNGGKLYPAKDAHMTGEEFRKFYPNFEKFYSLRDPKFSSNFIRRMENS